MTFSFDLGEKACREKFGETFPEELELLESLFYIKEKKIKSLSKKIKNTDHPDFTIELFLAYNMGLIYNSLSRLKSGYFGISQLLLRPALENITLSIYFFEFPEDERKYNRNSKRLYEKLNSLGYENWLKGVLQRIDKEGAKVFKDPKKNLSWKNFLLPAIEDASLFVHSNSGPIYTSVLIPEEGNPSGETYAYGPNWVKKELVEAAVWRIIEVLLADIAVMDRVFKIHYEKDDTEWDQFNEAVEELNEWKEKVSSEAEKYEKS